MTPKAKAQTMEGVEIKPDNVKHVIIGGIMYRKNEQGEWVEVKA